MVLVNYINVRNSQEYNILQMKFFLWVLFVLSIEVIPSLVFGGYEEGSAAFERSDYEIALKEFKALAVQKDSRGQYALGLMYDLGTGVSLDFKEAIRWYEECKETEFMGKFQLGLLVHKGIGIDKDEARGLRLLREAAEEGDHETKIKLADYLSKLNN